MITTPTQTPAQQAAASVAAIAALTAHINQLVAANASLQERLAAANAQGESYAAQIASLQASKVAQSAAPAAGPYSVEAPFDVFLLFAGTVLPKSTGAAGKDATGHILRVGDEVTLLDNANHAENRAYRINAALPPTLI